MLYQLTMLQSLFPNIDVINKKKQNGGKKQDNDKDKENEFDINISILSDKDETNGFENSECVLNIEGADVNHVLINTLRRVILTLIPCYAFDAQNINITKNTSIYNNDYMRLRLSNFPIYFNKTLTEKYVNLKKLEYKNVLCPEKTLITSHEMRLEYKANLGTAEVEEEQIIKNDITDNLTMVVNVKNNSTDTVLDLTTATPGVKFYYGKEQISHIYSKPLLIIQLRPGQEFACTMISSLNIAMTHAIYRPCSICTYIQNEDNENKYKFMLTCRRQISEKDLILRAISIIKNKIENTQSVFIENIEKYDRQKNKSVINDEDIDTSHFQKGSVDIEGEQHTLGNLLSRYLQEDENIEFSGYKVGHPNVNKVEIAYICSQNANIINIIKNVSGIITRLFDKFESEIKKLPDFGYKYI